MYGGFVRGIGPRYCPSIEDKVVRFQDKERHQLFLEPESRFYDDIYIQGFSTSMPYDVQEEMVHSLKGLENAKILKYAYAIEYDAIDPLEMQPSLENKKLETKIEKISSDSEFTTAMMEMQIDKLLDKKFKSLEKLQDYYISLFKRKSEDEQHLSLAISKLMDKNLFSEYEKHIKIMSYNDKFDMRIAIGQKKLLKKLIKQNHKHSIKLHKCSRKQDKCKHKEEVQNKKKEISVELKKHSLFSRLKLFFKNLFK